MKSYLELDVWIEARKLANDAYAITKIFPKEEQYSMISQMRRCAVSVVSNIAEGCGRSSSKETIYFLHISRGSLFELETQVYIAFDQNYLEENKLNEILEQITACKRLINGFINYYKKL
ncbi:four helix bundle protein [Galbibacter sp. EGI 63066]|uniref:four helix bundle protein n=1 Tax=Galbibacter sp. EGI 63066 TaxID=2993559 RepID=UPI002248B078|nr:four helix bundle protein [Galbibacter sp. EGI 63066]MCX2679474.1 four helix bundle protein [Galbibacter sp. EGI 63066]